MAAPSVTHTFSNGTAFDATQVNTNFTDIINGVADGTKDLSINALTCAGTATFNGNVTLGNASADDLTFTGSLASTIPVKTNATYNIGSATLGLAGVFIGSSSTFTTKIAAAATASWTMTLPAVVGTATNQYLRHTTTGSTTWDYLNDAISSEKTTAYSILASDNVIIANATGGAFTVTLPTAVGVAGKHYRIYNTGTSNNVSVATTSSQTMNGVTTRKIPTKDSFHVVSDGANWLVLKEVTVYAKYVSSATNTFANAGENRMQFDTSENDSLGIVTTGASWVATAPIAGKYRITVASGFNAVTSGGAERALIVLYKNGSGTSRNIAHMPLLSVSHVILMGGTCTIDLAATDTVAAYMNQNLTAGNITRNGSAADNFFEIERIGA